MVSELKDLKLVVYVVDFRLPGCLHSCSLVLVCVLLISFYSLSLLSEHPPQCFCITSEVCPLYFSALFFLSMHYKWVGRYLFPTVSRTCNACTCVLQLMFSKEFKETGSICEKLQQLFVNARQRRDRNRFSAESLAYALADPSHQ